MSDYHEKVIELMAIHKNKEQFFLQIKILLEQEIELFCKIDESTAIQLQEITNFEKKYNYRLSYYTFWNPSQKQYRSYLTKTFHEYSERIYFTCTEDYIEILNQLKHIQDVNQIHTLPFLSTQSTEEQQKVEDQNKDESLKAARNPKTYQKFSLIAAIIIGVISIGYLGYMNLSFNHAESVEAKGSNPKVDIASTKIPPKRNIEKKKPSEPVIPVVKLNSTINFSIPKGKVALTFDDGPSKYSKKMVDVLKKYKAGGTFFYIGTRVKEYPEYVEYAKNNGFSIGSHSMSHSSFTRLPIKKQEKEILQSDQLIKQITHEPVILFRPPYGAKNNSTEKLAQKYHLDIVLWDIDTEDWKSRNSKMIIQSVKKENASGSIILFHESQATLKALPTIIKYLQKQDLEIVSLK